MIDISQLNEVQRRELLAQLEYETRLPAKPDEAAQEFWEVLHDALDIPLRRAQPLARFLENYPRAKFDEMAQYTRYFCEEGAPELKKVQLHSVMVTVVRCLIAHLKARQIPATPAVICNSITVLEHAVEKRFPGYKAAKLLHRVAPLG
jgi:hypothetical protein